MSILEQIIQGVLDGLCFGVWFLLPAFVFIISLKFFRSSDDKK